MPREGLATAFACAAFAVGCYEYHLPTDPLPFDGGPGTDGGPGFDSGPGIDRGPDFDGGPGIDAPGVDASGFDGGPGFDAPGVDAPGFDGGRPDASRPDGGMRDGGPSPDGGRPRSRALRFERGQRVVVAPDLNLDITVDHTIELWARRRGDGPVTRKGEILGPHHLRFSVEGTDVVAGFAATAGASLLRAPIPFDVWTHIAFTVQVDASTGLLSCVLYVNASAVASGSFANILPDALNDMPFILGGFEGDVDEVRIFRVTRTGPQIAASMSMRLRPVPPNMEAYWPLEESGQIVIDRTLHGHEGVLGDLTTPDPADPTWITDGAF